MMSPGEVLDSLSDHTQSSSSSKDALAEQSQRRLDEVRAELREQCLEYANNYGPECVEAMRRFAIFPGLPPSQRAEVWRILLGYAPAHRSLHSDIAHRSAVQERLWKYQVQRRAAELSACLVYRIGRGRGLPHNECPVLAAFRVYCAIFRYRTSPGRGIRHPASREVLPLLLSGKDLQSLRAMKGVLDSVFARDVDSLVEAVPGVSPDELVQSDVFWGLVFLTGQQRRVVLSADGHFVQAYGMRHRVEAFERQLRLTDKPVHTLLETQLKIEHASYVEEWFRSLFAHPLRTAARLYPSLLPRLWDALIACPFQMEVLVAVALVSRVRDRLFFLAEGGRRDVQTFQEKVEAVANILDDLEMMSADDVDDMLTSIWERTPRLLHRRVSTHEMAENPVLFSKLEWPVVSASNDADPRVIRVCQFLLRAHGLGSMFFVDGQFGNRTIAAVRRFRRMLREDALRDEDRQGSLSCPPSDVFDRSRIDKGSIGNSALIRDVPHADLKTDAGSTLDVEAIAGDIWPYLIKTLEPRKHKGFAVKALQTALEIHGYSKIRPDGFFGNFTAQAVEDFQENQAANLIDVDGVVGPLTWLHLIGTASHVDDASSLEG